MGVGFGEVLVVSCSEVKEDVGIFFFFRVFCRRWVVFYVF